MRAVAAFSLLASASLLVLAADKIEISLAARNWPSVSGIVSAFDVKDYDTSGRSPSYEVQATYAFEVAGRQYTSSRLTVDDPLILNADRIARHFGSMEPETCTVWYDPDAPSTSILYQPPWQGHLAVLVLLGCWTLASLVWAARSFLRGPGRH